MSNETFQIPNILYEYLNQYAVREPTLFQKHRIEIQQQGFSNIHISPQQGQLIAFLIQLIGAKYALELGVYTGYSSLWIASSLSTDGQLIACDVNKESIQIAKKYWQLANLTHKIDLKLAPALDTLNNLIQTNKQNYFDVAFIDADKLNYESYYELCLELIRPKGLIIIDNVCWKGLVTEPNPIKKTPRLMQHLNQKIHADSRVEMTIIPLGDGLSLIQKK